MANMSQCYKKNYYLLNSLIKSISDYDVISFDIFDTLLLRNVLFPSDIFKLLAEKAISRFNIEGFNYVRISAETDGRIHSPDDDISIQKIYENIAHTYSDEIANELMSTEIDLELENICANELAIKVYNEAVKQNKRIVLITDSCLDENTMQKMLKKCGITEYEKLYISGQIGMAKGTGNLWRYAIDDTGADPRKWLHIGDDYSSDAVVPRSFNITTAYLRCPRDWFFIDRMEKHKLIEEREGHTIPEEKLDDSVEFSVSTAKRINKLYVQCKSPSDDIAISVKNVSMMFNMSSEKVDNFKEFVIKMLKGKLRFEEFWALKDVSFDVMRGERIGLIGINGSGKSTMLKVVSGVLKPTKGNVKVIGSVAPMIELGAGFDFELSARENVFLNGAILGYNKNEMEKFYTDIISFAELEEFQDIAIKNFSSGMIARLGFAIATCHVPDVLIIDEILAVGDLKFQKKCHDKIKQLTDSGATVLFVSHNPGDIVELCDKAVWLDHGKVFDIGESQFVVEKYVNKIK